MKALLCPSCLQILHTSKDEAMCVYCGERMTTFSERWSMEREHKMRKACQQYGYDEGCIIPNCANRPILHHFIPRSKGGGDDVSNLIAICKEHEMPIHAATQKMPA